MDVSAWIEKLTTVQSIVLGLIASTTPVYVAFMVARKQVQKAQKAMLSVPPTAPMPQEEDSAAASLTPAARITALESALRDTEWQRNELERVLGDARREIAQLRSSLTRERLAREQTLEELDHTAHAIELDRIQQRLIDSGLTPIDEPLPLPTRVARRPRRPT